LRPILVVTPATKFGSWAWIEKALAERPDQPAIVVSYGRSDTAPPNVRFVALPVLIDYAAWGPRLAERRYLALNLLYYAPLLPIAWWLAVRHRPSVLLANGVLPAAILGPLTMFGARLILAFHGSIGHVGGRWHATLRRVLRPVDVAFANSAGSADDLAHVLDRGRIQIVEHWADAVFFNTSLERAGGSPLRVLFVGRLDDEKFEQCLRVSERLAEEGVIELSAVGTGPLQQALGRPGLNHLGYVSDKHRLAQIYAESDVVWAPADVTYVAIPGAEGLASGCPLIISARPAVFTHARDGLKVPRDIVPDGIGRVVDADDEAEATLRDWAATGIDESVRRQCRAYATEHYSIDNIRRVADALVP